MEGQQVAEFYSDNVELGGGPFGVTLNFNRSKRTPSAPGRPTEYEPEVTIRMSWEHFKAMVFFGWRHVRQVERDIGVSYPIPTTLLSQWGIGLEDWEGFWKPAPKGPSI
jgi:hypothetical protein